MTHAFKPKFLGSMKILVATQWNALDAAVHKYQCNGVLFNVAFSCTEKHAKLSLLLQVGKLPNWEKDRPWPIQWGLQSHISAGRTAGCTQESPGIYHCVLRLHVKEKSFNSYYSYLQQSWNLPHNCGMRCSETYPDYQHIHVPCKLVKSLTGIYPGFSGGSMTTWKTSVTVRTTFLFIWEKQTVFDMRFMFSRLCCHCRSLRWWMPRRVRTASKR